MKAGDMITANTITMLINDSLETSLMSSNVYYGKKREITQFRHGNIAIVISKSEDQARVKVFYQSDFWWANVADVIMS